uniref:Uncharacterized protein n=1 Tax=Myoviridae sp. ctj3P51 TaxID=2826687 RepID=A0A8S5NQ23_9CAUD|nr:MAG TPA: hypothetical protein [Myoviridae sp. ctj3P51]
MNVLSIIIASLSIVCYAITIITYHHQNRKEAAQEVQRKTELRDDVKYTRQIVDEMNARLQELGQQSNRHDTLLAQHEIRIVALERWKESHYKE